MMWLTVPSTLRNRLANAIGAARNWLVASDAGAAELALEQRLKNIDGLRHAKLSGLKPPGTNAPTADGSTDSTTFKLITFGRLEGNTQRGDAIIIRKDLKCYVWTATWQPPNNNERTDSYDLVDDQTHDDPGD